MQINIILSKESRLPSLDFNNIPFGKIFTDHMFTVDFEDGQWVRPSIEPYGNISISPALSAIHYGQSLFEGMKAHKHADGSAYLFRPLDNWHRLNVSAERLCMPTLPKEIFIESLQTLVNIDKEWIPTHKGSALYVRPFMFATDDCIGVRPSNNYKFMIICCPANPFYSRALRVVAEQHYVRAVEGGEGFAKAAGNYGASMLPTKLAHDKGFDQIIWLDGREQKYLEESGTMNLFFVADGKLYTPKLEGTILDGYTRASIIQLAKDNNIEVVEARISINELMDWANSGKLTEGFGTGTAATVAHFSSFSYNEKEYQLLPIDQCVISTKLAKELNDIKSFKADDKHGWMWKI
ncbi:MAG: branched-chain amino acid aminotransferase [Bacteroidota bacterium]|nr:branched-chain amino acid aminotransferase [Bacteroidota bacterium]